MTGSETLLVIVVEDDSSLRKAVRRTLEARGHRVETYALAEDFLKAPRPDGPACLLLDLWLPGISGLELQERLRELSLALPVVFMSGHGDVPASVKAMQAGAVDFLTKPLRTDTLVSAVDAALERSHRELERKREIAEARLLVESLSHREAAVFRMVVAGLLNKQIAGQLGLSEKTVKLYRGRMTRKLGRGSVPALVKLAQTAGFLE